MSNKTEYFKIDRWELTIEEGYLKIEYNLAPILTLYGVGEAVADIEAIKDDPGRAHMKEKELWGDVLEAIRGGIENPQELAKECLKTKDIKFNRGVL